MTSDVPRKIRDLLKDLRNAGFTLSSGGKGSHRKYEHPAVKIPVIIPGRDGDDAKAYLERHISEKITESKS
jgi:predicted RNA binding protein YcfA (HicA-like mRNA interferase family)